MRVPLELLFLEEEYWNTKTLLRSAVVKTGGNWKQVVLQHTDRTLHNTGLEIGHWEHLLPRGSTRMDRPKRFVTLAILAAIVFGRFLLPLLEELFTGKVIANTMETERARFATLQQDVKHLTCMTT